MLVLFIYISNIFLPNITAKPDQFAVLSYLDTDFRILVCPKTGQEQIHEFLERGFICIMVGVALLILSQFS